MRPTDPHAQKAQPPLSTKHPEHATGTAETSAETIREADGELTDEHLNSVAGGLALQEATQMESRKFQKL